MTRVPEVTPELPNATWRLILRLMGRLPNRALSRSFGWLADRPIPRQVRRPLLGAFTRALGIDIAEAEHPLEEYPTLNAFFVRRLRAGARTWPVEPARIASPVDGILGSFGPIREGRAIQAKGHTYSIGDLLMDERDAGRFTGGTFVTIYLSPRHYHRIHAPAPGTIPSATYVPGDLYPVNAPAVMHIPRLFARNERVICQLDTEAGRIAVVAVGAYNVGRISTAFDPSWGGGPGGSVGPGRPPSPLRRRYEPPLPAATGAEIMAFHLGSTVVLLFEPVVKLRSDLQPGGELRLGEPLTP